MISARCTKISGNFLAACTTPDQRYSIEDILLADDRSHMLLSNIAARILTRDSIPGQVVRLATRKS